MMEVKRNSTDDSTSTTKLVAVETEKFVDVNFDFR